MFWERNKRILLSAGGCIAVWWIVYAWAVAPAWSAAETERTAAEAARKKWRKYYRKDRDGKTRPLPQARAALKRNDEALKREKTTAAEIFFADEKQLQKYSRAAAGEGDPNNYFDRLRRRTTEQIVKQYGLTVDPKWNDLGFRGNVLGTDEVESKVELNLLRLAMADRAAEAARRAASDSAVPAQFFGFLYGKPRAAKFPRDEDEAAAAEAAGSYPADTQKEKRKPPAERIIEVPMRLRVRMPEKNFVRFLYELQRPPKNPDDWGFLTVRGFQIVTREKYRAAGVIEGSVRVCALLPESLFRGKLRIPLKEPGRGRDLYGTAGEDTYEEPLWGARE